MRVSRSLMIVFLGFASTCFAQQPTWTMFTPSGSGPGGGGGSQSTAYDPSSDTLIVFGGYNPTASPCCGETNDVWVLKNASAIGSSWQKETVVPDPVAGLPLPRQAHSAVYDPATNRLIIFGGGQVGGGAFSALFQDVWVLTNANYNGGMPQWISLTPSGGPPAAREGHAAVYNQATNEMFLFGGGNNGIMSVPGDVWVLENANGIGTSAWIQLSQTGAAPGPLENFATAYDPASGRWTVVGGCCEPHIHACKLGAGTQCPGPIYSVDSSFPWGSATSCRRCGRLWLRPTEQHPNRTRHATRGRGECYVATHRRKWRRGNASVDQSYS
jgi:hypothetical protein